MMLDSVFKVSRFTAKEVRGTKTVEDPAPWKTGSCQFLSQLRALRRVPPMFWPSQRWDSLDVPSLVRSHRRRREYQQDGQSSDQSRTDSVLIRLVGHQRKYSTPQRDGMRTPVVLDTDDIITQAAVVGRYSRIVGLDATNLHLGA
ncbi:hypothetical protein BO78DRAFT_6637 [Aspergillus sclerotiicarbonarius CBS 121057]|uniref:Uncharacterized protein n=1 Tax=Aspergillus sclerotiicarbonarius (strain CBS 121057 / IBT 28362) TaxID=1448318 RepID=A0A319EQR7_ASPSB|nr:hypothetical protein BO78DRAFT_6637 [Aspergillus sclerotiicarbonarius CBS 121057]